MDLLEQEEVEVLLDQEEVEDLLDQEEVEDLLEQEEDVDSGEGFLSIITFCKYMSENDLREKMQPLYR